MVVMPIMSSVITSTNRRPWRSPRWPNNTPPNASYWVVAADATDPPDLLDGGDWLYKYRWPSDCLRLRRLVP